jgi:hypothetical protein
MCAIPSTALEEKEPKAVDDSNAVPPLAPFELIQRKFPAKKGLLRKVLHLWGVYYRVNFHDPEKSNYIVQSHFVRVAEGLVEEITE